MVKSEVGLNIAQNDSKWVLLVMSTHILVWQSKLIFGCKQKVDDTVFFSADYSSMGSLWTHPSWCELLTLGQFDIFNVFHVYHMRVDRFIDLNKFIHILLQKLSHVRYQMKAYEKALLNKTLDCDLHFICANCGSLKPNNWRK